LFWFLIEKFFDVNRFFCLGFGFHPFADLHRHNRVSNPNSSSSRRGGGGGSGPHQHRSSGAAQQISLFDNFFSPMRMSIFDHHHHHHDPFNAFDSGFAGQGVGTISSFNFSFGGGSGARPVARKTTKATKMVNGRRITTTRTEENGQTTETVEEDGQVTSKKVNGVAQAIQ